jgi:hypothetical protein
VKYTAPGNTAISVPAITASVWPNSLRAIAYTSTAVSAPQSTLNSRPAQSESSVAR